MGPEYQFDLSPQSDQLEAIGMVAVEWSYLESVIDAAIWNLSNVPSEAFGEAITTHLSGRARLDMLSTLFHLTYRLPGRWRVSRRESG